MTLCRALPLLLLLAGCGSEGTPAATVPEPSPAPPAEPEPGPFELPDDPEALFLEVWRPPGFVPVEFALGRPPLYALTVGGGLFFEGPIPEIWPGPILPDIRAAQLAENEVAEVIAAIATTVLPAAHDLLIRQPSGGPILAEIPPAAEDRAAFAAFARTEVAGSEAKLDRDFVERGFLLALAAAGASPETRIRLVPAGDAVEITASFPLRAPFLGERFWNLAATAEPKVRDRALRLGVRSLRVGGIEAPAIWVRPVSRVLSRFVGRHEVVAGFLDRFEEIRFEDSRLVARPAARPDGDPGAAAAVLGYLALLERDADAIRARPDRFVGALEGVFGLAAERSGSGGAVRENRAALLALGGAVGHPSLLDLAGVPGASESAGPLSRRLALTVHGRRDWARHFLLSAGLAQLAPAGLREGAGLLKERLDAAPGARGFSFADLLMNEAGTRFGDLATRDEAAARALQGRIARGIAEDDLIPRDSALPEGLSVARLESEFGDVHGEGFRVVEAEIARRLGDLPLYGR